LRVFQPELRGVPLVVLSNNDGCVIARSNPLLCRKAGVPPEDARGRITRDAAAARGP
jgi:nucleotidyltransferase/DNA polymerase involved in DNA repair